MNIFDVCADRKLLPDGGDGGPGGDVVLQACKECVSKLSWQ